MILQAVFWILSKSVIFSSVNLLCHTWHDCSSMDRIQRKQIFNKSSDGTLNSTSLCRRLILLLARLTMQSVFGSHVSLSFMITPNNLASLTISNTSLVEVVQLHPHIRHLVCCLFHHLRCTLPPPQLFPWLLRRQVCQLSFCPSKSFEGHFVSFQPTFVLGRSLYGLLQ